METLVKEIYSLNDTVYSVEYENFRIVLAGVDPQPQEDFININECFLSKKSFQKLRNILQARKETPTIMITHAPPIGCGLKTVSHVHLRASNAYLDQNHHPEKWLKLISDNPQIILWFSGHYHLGQHYENSKSSRYGIDFYPPKKSDIADCFEVDFVRVYDQI